MLKPKKSIENMQGYFVPMYEKDWDIKIDSNENNYGPSPKVIDAIKNIDYKNISFYPFYGELSQKIADFYNFNIENIKVTNGADEALQAIIQTYLEQGESLITLDISFEMPNIYTEIQGGNIIKVPFKSKWDFPVDDFIKELKSDNIKIIYLASPNNPTGNIISKNDIQSIIEAARNKVVIIDETYANYANITYKEFAKKYDNVFIVRSFSKDFALAGLRLGIIISDENNINNLKKVVSPFSVNNLAMLAGIKALEDADYFFAIREEIINSKQDLKVFFESLGAKVYDSYANFLLVDFKEKAEFIYNKLKKENISVKLFKKGHKLENHLRVTIPTTTGVEKIKQVLKIKPSLVFDMDGVLIDARKSYRIAVEKTFEKLSGKTITQEEIQAAKNLGGLNNDWDLTQYLLNKSGFYPEYEEIINVFQSLYWDNGNGLINNEDCIIDRNLFEKLSKNYNLSIYTGRLKQEAIFAIERFKLNDLFYPIITMNDIPLDKGKPNPYGLNMTKQLTLSDKYYYFGDTTDDILAANSAEYIAVGVLPPQDKSDNLVKIMQGKGAKYVIKSVNEIEQVLEQKHETVQ